MSTSLSMQELSKTGTSTSLNRRTAPVPGTGYQFALPICSTAPVKREPPLSETFIFIRCRRDDSTRPFLSRHTKSWTRAGGKKKETREKKRDGVRRSGRREWEKQKPCSFSRLRTGMLDCIRFGCIPMELLSSNIFDVLFTHNTSVIRGTQHSRTIQVYVEELSTHAQYKCT